MGQTIPINAMEMRMKKQLLTMLALGLFAAPVFAQDGGPEGGPKGPGGHGGPGGPMMEKVDTDKDGKISRGEFQARGDEMFKEADTNGDGFITAEEGKAAHEARRAKWKEHKAEFMKNREGAGEHKGPLGGEHKGPPAKPE